MPLIVGTEGEDRFDLNGGTGLRLDARGGNDRLIVHLSTQYEDSIATLGAGVDTVVVPALVYFDPFNDPGVLAISDFATGPGGDQIDVIGGLISSTVDWDFRTNPFATGHLALQQSGDDVLVTWTKGITNGQQGGGVVLLQDRLAADFTAENFLGYDPDGAQPAATTVAGGGGADTIVDLGLGDDTLRGLGGDDVIRGYLGNDTLEGGDGQDDLDGRWGSDTLLGGAGNDLLTDTLHGNDIMRGEDGNDRLIVTRVSREGPGPTQSFLLDGGAGNDEISVTGAPKGSYIVGITGGDGNDVIKGIRISGSIDAGGGNDRVEIATNADVTITLGAGADQIQLPTGSGDKVVTDFAVGTGGDIVDLSVFTQPGDNPFADGRLVLVQDGADTLVTRQQGTLLLTLLDVTASDLSPYNLDGFDSGQYSPRPTEIFGTSASETLIGGPEDNQIYGFAGDDTLIGDAGGDRLEGGVGDDLYRIDSVGDEVVEFANAGTDSIESSVSYTIRSNVENIRLTGTDAINSNGNILDNVMRGNSAANILNGKAGDDAINGFAGADTMIGGTGNDVYYVDNAGDQVTEARNEGFDLIYSSVSYTIRADVEALTLTGSAAINSNGNVLANVMRGNAAANILNGKDGNDALNGFGGADTMIGGGGNDTFYVDNAGDEVSELGAQGSDRIFSSVSYTARTNVEDMTLTGTSAINGNGNSGTNRLTGNAADNALNGKAGNDTLIGGGGADRFFFDTALNAATNVDDILDFDGADDSIFLSRAVFAAVGPAGALAANALHAGPSAQDAEDRILYDEATGNLFYDADGTGAAAAVLFAHVDPGTALTNADFIAYG